VFGTSVVFMLLTIVLAFFTEPKKAKP